MSNGRRKVGNGPVALLRYADVGNSGKIAPVEMGEIMDDYFLRRIEVELLCFWIDPVIRNN